MALDPQPQPVIRMVSDLAQPAASSVEPPDLRSERIKEFLQASNLAANTRKSYRLELDRFIAWSSKTWINVTPRDVARFKQYLMDECRTRQGKALSPSAINQALTALKSFYKWFQLSGYMELAAVLPTAAVKFEKLGNPLPRHLSHEQMAAIAQAVTGDQDIDLRNRALLAVLTHGLRAEDVSALNVGNYDGTRLRFVRKKDKSEAIVPLRQSAREQILAYLEQRRYASLPAGATGSAGR